MAQPDNVLDILEMLAQAGLDFTPKNTDALADVWVKAFRDIPDEIFTQAAHDYLISETRWPAPAKIRQIAERVKANNGQSAAPNQFKPLAEVSIVWEPAGIKDRAVFPPDVQAKIDLIIERIGEGILPDATLEYIDRLTAPYREVQHEPV